MNSIDEQISDILQKHRNTYGKQTLMTPDEIHAVTIEAIKDVFKPSTATQADIEGHGNDMWPEKKSNWLREPAETTFVWVMGSVYPIRVVCDSYETNQLGEKRLAESKTFKLVEEK